MLVHFGCFGFAVGVARLEDKRRDTSMELEMICELLQSHTTVLDVESLAVLAAIRHTIGGPTAVTHGKRKLLSFTMDREWQMTLITVHKLATVTT